MKTSYCIQRVLPAKKVMIIRLQKINNSLTTATDLYEDPNISLNMSLVTTFCDGIFLETNPGGIPVVLFTVGGIFVL